MEMNEQQKSKLNSILEHANFIINTIYEYEGNRPGSIALTKIEECIMWLQIMISTTPLKAKEGELISGQPT